MTAGVSLLLGLTHIAWVSHGLVATPVDASLLRMSDVACTGEYVSSVAPHINCDGHFGMAADLKVWCVLRRWAQGQQRLEQAVQQKCFKGTSRHVQPRLLSHSYKNDMHLSHDIT